MRFVFLGSPPFATPVLDRLIRSRHLPLALLTPPDRPRGRGRAVERSPLVELALARSVSVLQPEDPHAPGLLDHLQLLAPDVLVVASYGKLLKRELYELAPHGALNVHASLLPRHRGASPVQAAILCGDERTGVSIQRIVERLDAGDVLLSAERSVAPEETAGELLAALAVLGGDAMVEALDRLEAGTAVYTPQDPEHATYARKLRKEHGHLNFERSAVELGRQVRAMNPWPGARCLDPKGREVTVLRARVVALPVAPPGTILEADERLVVATGESALELLELLPAGKRPMSAGEFLRGARLAPGGRLRSLPGGVSLPYMKGG